METDSERLSGLMEATRQLGVRAGISTDVRLTPQHRDLLSGCTVRLLPRRRGKAGLQAVVRGEQEANTRKQNGQMVPGSLDGKGETWCPHGEVAIWKTEEHGGRNKKTIGGSTVFLPGPARLLFSTQQGKLRTHFRCVFVFDVLLARFLFFPLSFIHLGSMYSLSMSVL